MIDSSVRLMDLSQNDLQRNWLWIGVPAHPDGALRISNVRLPGQYQDDETGLHYNYRRYYDTQSGRYVTQDPIGVEGGINQYQYAEADPVNLSDPTGECPMCVAYAACVAQCMLEDVAVNALTGQCNNLGDSAKSCAASCLLGPVGKLSKWFGRGKKGATAASKMPGPNKSLTEGASCAFSFPSDTLVHVKPEGASAQDAQQSNANLKPISELQVGDEVLALSEWKSKGSSALFNEQLSYEKVTDLFVSNKPQKLIHLTLDNGQIINATENHPFKTTDGWRDAILLKKGSSLLLKGADGERVATIAAIRIETKTLPVFNLEVANAHTFFVGQDGAVVHNGRCPPSLKKKWEKLHGKDWPLNPPTEKIRPGLPQDGHHIKPVNRGGAPNDPANITPKTPSDHTKWHQEHGYK